jgi:thiol-disulfide isomerase/thioredoxin
VRGASLAPPASTLQTMRRLAPLAAVLVLASCGGDDETAGGAADLPGAVPAGVEFVAPPASALAAPDFTAELVDGTPVTASELWRDRPVVLVFTASYCDRCREIHRAAAEAVAAHDGAVGLLGVVGEDDVDGGREYADELDLGHPIAVASERTWLDYAAREPGLVVLVGEGGKVLRGWPSGATAEQLRPRLEELFAR